MITIVKLHKHFSSSKNIQIKKQFKNFQNYTLGIKYLFNICTNVKQKSIQKENEANEKN